MMRGSARQLVFCCDVFYIVPLQVTLGVLDANDNGPVFSSDLVVFQTAENQTAPVEIGSVVATDVDEGMGLQ